MSKVSLDLNLEVNRASTIKKRIKKLRGASDYQKETATKLVLIVKEAQTKVDSCKLRGKITTVKKKGILNLNFSFYSNDACIFSGTIKNNDSFYLNVVDTIDVFRDLDIFKAYILNEAGEKKIKEGEN